jgi:hypothetical protein
MFNKTLLLSILFAFESSLSSVGQSERNKSFIDSIVTFANNNLNKCELQGGGWIKKKTFWGWKNIGYYSDCFNMNDSVVRDEINFSYKSKIGKDIDSVALLIVYKDSILYFSKGPLGDTLRKEFLNYYFLNSKTLLHTVGMTQTKKVIDLNEITILKKEICWRFKWPRNCDLKN